MLKKNLNYFFLNAWLSMCTKSTYRAASILKLCVNLFVTVLYICLWKAIYNGEGEINGFTLSDMLVYVFISRILKNLYPYDISRSYGELIKRGKIAILLLRPVRLELQLLSASIGSALYDFCFCSLPTLFLLWFFIPPIPMGLVNFLQIIFWLFSSYAFICLLELVVGTLSYYLQNLWGLNVFKSTMFTFLSGELLPIRFYPAFLLKLFEKLPFVAIYYVPVLLVLGKAVEEMKSYLAVLWVSCLILLVIYILLSRKMIRHITVQGG